MSSSGRNIPLPPLPESDSPQVQSGTLLSSTPVSPTKKSTKAEKAKKKKEKEREKEREKEKKGAGSSKSPVPTHSAAYASKMRNRSKHTAENVYVQSPSTKKQASNVYTDDSIYGSLYYVKFNDGDDELREGEYIGEEGLEDGEVQYEYLCDEDRLTPITRRRNPLNNVSSASTSALPPPLPPPNRRRSSVAPFDNRKSLDPSSYMHEDISREESETILFEDMRSGAFLVRVKEQDRLWALSVVWKGMFVHHLIMHEMESNKFYINDEEFPLTVFSLRELIGTLYSQQSDTFRIIEQDLRHPIPPPMLEAL